MTMIGTSTTTRARDRAGRTRRDSRDRAACADGGHGGFLIRHDVHAGRREAAEQVEEEVARVPHAVLDVVAEDVEVEHVAAEVEEAAVQEHRRKERQDAVPRREVHHVAERCLYPFVVVFRMGMTPYS